MASLILVVNVVGELQRKRTLAASRGFLAAARLSCLKHAPNLIIFGTHNLQTLKHDTVIIKLLLMQFYVRTIRPKSHHRK